MAKKQKNSSASRARDDGRRQILLYLKADVILELKTEALRRETTAYELAEAAIESFLAKRKKPRI